MFRKLMKFNFHCICYLCTKDIRAEVSAYSDKYGTYNETLLTNLLIHYRHICSES